MDLRIVVDAELLPGPQVAHAVCWEVALGGLHWAELETSGEQCSPS
jgi:hypothetical protein